MDPFVLVTFYRKSGKIVVVLEGLSSGALKLWALQNTTKTRDTLIFNKNTGEVIYYVEGREAFPEIHEHNLGHIDDYCPGFSETVNS